VSTLYFECKKDISSTFSVEQPTFSTTCVQIKLYYVIV